jgi:hypothetical protein
VSDTDGYVHRPDAGDESDDERAAEAAQSRSEPEPEGFGARGWLLVAVVVTSVLVVPGIVYLFPALPADAGLPFLVAMLVFPMLPAVLLGLTAVWSMTAATGDRETD